MIESSLNPSEETIIDPRSVLSLISILIPSLVTIVNQITSLSIEPILHPITSSS